MAMLTIQGNIQSVLQRSTPLLLMALLLTSPLAGQTASSQKTPVKAAQDYTRNVDPFIGVDWDGANTFISLGQIWVGTPTYSVDDENGFNDQGEGGPKFSQAVTVQDGMPGKIHCGPYAGGPVKSGSTTVECN